MKRFQAFSRLFSVQHNQEVDEQEETFRAEPIKREDIIFIQMLQILQLNFMIRIIVFTLFVINLQGLLLSHQNQPKDSQDLQSKDAKVNEHKVQETSPPQKTPNCPQKQVFNKTEQKCVPLQKEVGCSPGNMYDQNLKQCRMICSDHKHYSYKEQKCLANSLVCERDERYSRKNKKCIKIDRNCKPGFVFNQKSLLCKKIVSCANDEELNPRWQICEKKEVVCAKGQLLDYKTNTCVARKFITNPYHDKLSYIGNFKNYVSYYNTAKNVDKLLTDCPFSTPFYQKSTDMCISCPQNSPIFDLTNDKCIACRYNQVYDPYQHKCRDQKLHFDAPVSMWRMAL